ncbi:MAG: type VI secretion system protein TssA [Alphaproteobacteria bacterium]|nr:type VI secretion system protein TssA [Alphaproteobacteria bacterium]
MKQFQLSENVWKALLRPISDKEPSGKFFLYEPLYDQIREARFHEDDSLPQGIWQRDLKKADWSKVEALCLEALQEKTKDLQIAAWLTEAWLVLYGIEGFAKGLELCRLLAFTFWDSVYPELRPDDAEYRLSPLIWINEKLEERLYFITITKPADIAQTSLSFADYAKAQQNDTLGRRDPKIAREHEKTGELTLAQFKRSQTLTPSSFYRKLHEQLSTCLTQARSFEELVGSKLTGYDGLLVRLRTTLQEILKFVDGCLEDRREVIPDASTESTSDSKGKTMTGKGTSGMSGPIKSREDAYQCLAEAADFLAHLEPHSPTPYLVRRAITWGSMSLIDLMQEIVHDPNDYRQILQLLGISHKSEHTGS